MGHLSSQLLAKRLCKVLLSSEDHGKIDSYHPAVLQKTYKESLDQAK